MLCAACGSPLRGAISIGGTTVCRGCAPVLRERVEADRASGETVGAARIAREIYRGQHRGGDYLLRDIPLTMLTTLKHRAVDARVSVRELILEALWRSVKRP